MKIEKKSQEYQSFINYKRRHRFYGLRPYISTNQIAYMYLLSPLTLCLSTLKCQLNLKYPLKIFRYMKKNLLEKRFSYQKSKNESMSKFLIRGYQYQMFLIDGQHKKRTKFPVKFNLTYIREWFQSLKYKQSFFPLIQQSLKKRSKGDNKISQRFSKIINQIIQCQRKGLIKQSKNLYQNIFKRIRMPWTQNLYQRVRQFAKKLYQKYCEEYHTENNNQLQQNPNIDQSILQHKNVQNKIKQEQSSQSKQ